MNKRYIALTLTGALIASLLPGCKSLNEPIPGPDPEVSEEPEAPATQTPELPGYNLLWADEFDGDTLNEDIWTMEVREAGWTNHELQSYEASTDNIFVKDGCLTLKAIKTEKDNGSTSYTSGKVNSQNKADFMYGKVVIRAKAPEGQGLWPAGWMMPTDESLMCRRRIRPPTKGCIREVLASVLPGLPALPILRGPVRESAH